MSTGRHTSAETTHLHAERFVLATPQTIFALLTDPSRHHLTEPTDWVRGSLETAPPRITEVGQVFGIEMFHVGAGGRYEIHNLVIDLEPDRAIAWRPSQRMPDGSLTSGGWTWRYDLDPAPDGTGVRLTYDWSATPPEVAEQVGGLPAVGTEFLNRSLAALASVVEDRAA